MKINKIVSAIAISLLVAACAPEVGSEAWCAAMKEKPKGDWTANETMEYGKSCVFK
ncbi:DUF3012 domain-containing protein [Spongiibacter nanhainus]|uniref:DUF3012 domain-containing protein n=1 Tax=Spongiibacter nanhainus TaxID=2794344 RepID=A0A7T4QYA7_9GAMM|nr:DUF3012 domain-containing protein [Spongiibacter nanhainus]QQD16917.1 DUF3012 domain-containing protein [Spongiibacter nanhainus]